ncbi:lytic murein transglycosylase [Kaustia mangrovi]|uniref:Lytic murein transglycosylase n=1 Tax=Kaustia mangrovi TaxID=2593653 RepID=A0A7S8C4P4_9HYPH|nr:lytic murein transglycosylase [Kaustia mangrovi]QPC43267.1 lytic murein transglycosylase [Kaustia mangrovi]
MTHRSRPSRFVAGVFARLALALALTALAAGLAGAADRAQVERQFHAWLTGTVWPDARTQGVSAETFRAAGEALTLDWSLPGLVPPGSGARVPEEQHQAEFRAPGRYFSESQFAPLERIARARMGQWSKTLAAVERRYGVPGGIVVAIWGRESAFGNAKLAYNALRVVATRAFMDTRPEVYYPELIAGLVMLERGHVRLASMASSWGGAMGQPQFLPSKFLDYAVDFDGDGRRDIWQSVPDTLASIANYLKAHGWQAGRPWGVEVTVPKGDYCVLEGPHQGRSLADWRKYGVSPAGGGAFPKAMDRGELFLLMPGGRLGPAFLVTRNFYVLKDYNESDVYALFVGHLADRMRGGGAIRGRWSTRGGFSRGDVRAMQERLVADGHDVGGVDGLIGFRTRIAVGQWQRAHGRPATCFPDADLVREIARSR